MRVKRLTEKSFMNTVVQYARLNGWLVYHTFDSRRSAPGFPDCVLVRDGVVIFAELKTDAGKLTADQEEWLDALREAGEFVRVWRPADWPDIERLLRRPAA